MTTASISAVSALFASAIGRTVISDAKNGVAEVTYKVARLDEKVGTMKNGEKAPYVVLAMEGDTATVLRLHPEHAKRLFKNQTDSGLTVVAEATTEVAGTPTAQEQVELQKELVGEQTTVEATAPAKEATAPKAPSKKDKTIAMFAEMTAKGLARKDIVARMKSELGLSVPGANTYYQNCKSGAWK